MLLPMQPEPAPEAQQSKASLRGTAILAAASGGRRRGLLARLAVCAWVWWAGQAQAPGDWHTGPGCRWRALPAPTAGRTGFTLMPPEVTGVAFTNHLAEATSALNRILENGSGVALGDVDGDGWCDVYFCRLEGHNVLYRNLGNWQFQDLTEAAGVACPGQYSTGAAFADIDGDGDLDLLVNCLGGGTRAFLNDGHGHFTEMTDTRLARKFGSTSLALADIDGDGNLDLYVANYRATTYKDRPPGLKVEATVVDGKIVVTPQDRFIPIMPRAGAVEVIELGDPDILYLNTGWGRFAPVSWTRSFFNEEGQPLRAPPTDWALSAMFRDLNGDGAPDIYVCNDFFFFLDRVWLNEASSRFRAIPRLALRNVTLSSMGVDFADINRDGFDDFFVSDMVSLKHAWRHRQRPDMMKGVVNQPLEDPEARPEVARNTLCLNRGDGTYAEIAQLSGVDFSEWSWGAVFLDADLDGWEDIIIPTGNNHDVQDGDVKRAQASRRRPDSLESRILNWRELPVLATPILAFHNNHDLTFSETGANWGFSAPGPFQGMALADLDNDGDLDVVVNRLNNFAGLYRNETASPRLAVRLKGAGHNTRGIGARIIVTGGPVTQSQEMICGGRYLSCDDTMRVFAAGTPTNELTFEVIWRSGKRSVVEGALPNRLYEISEAAAAPTNHASRLTSPASFFADASDLLRHQHADEPFDDFTRQPLLSRKLSRLGPGVSWVDVDGDGWDDLVIGAGRGGQLAVCRNDTRGGFVALTNAELAEPATRDLTAILGWTPAPGQAVLLAGTANYEEGLTNGAAVRQYDLRRRTSTDLLPAYESSVGPLALADIDGDGDLDLFVGGRVLPGHYPAVAASRLYRNEGGAFRLDGANATRLQSVGLVSGAVFSDLDGDGWPDLVLACEWGPIRIFRNNHGQLVPWDAPLVWPATSTLNPQPSTLNQLTGWWNGVTTGDLDGDGRLDIIASNWGRNTRFQRHLAHPLRVYYGDLSESGAGDLIETYFEPTLNKWVPWRDYETMAQALPFIVETIPTFKAYGETGIEDLLGERFKAAQHLEAKTLDSMVFLNRGDRFEARPLPVEAQFAPAFGVVVADFDGDGSEDVFLSQNFFGVEPETSRYDAGIGLWLRGDGKGNLAAVSGQESGVKVYGEQRGCAVGDYDGDGRVDLVVTQNGHQTKLYHNVRAKPGLRARLRGPPGNPTGVGAALRLKFGERLGPAREIHAGSGYWSQDSAVQAMGLPEPASQLWVRWPGGRTATLSVPAGARELTASAE